MKSANKIQIGQVVSVCFTLTLSIVVSASHNVQSVLSNPFVPQATFVAPATGFMGWMYNQSGHKGLDIWEKPPNNYGIPCDTQDNNSLVRAVYAGTVVEIYRENRPAGGWFSVSDPSTEPRASVVAIKHTGLSPNPLYSLYLHMAKDDETQSCINIKKGDTVSQGQVIGRMGNWRYVGYTTSITHLHFEINTIYTCANCSNIDPSTYLGFDVNYANYSQPGHIIYGGSFPPQTVSVLVGDVNGDGVVDIFDYNLIISYFGRTGAPGFVPADIDRNGRVDNNDRRLVNQNLGLKRTRTAGPIKALPLSTLAIPNPPSDLSISYELNNINESTIVTVNWADNSDNENGYNLNWDIDGYAADSFQSVPSATSSASAILAVIPCGPLHVSSTVNVSINAFNTDGTSATIPVSNTVPLVVCAQAQNFIYLPIILR